MSWPNPHPANAERAEEICGGVVSHPPEVVVAMAIADRLAGIEEALVVLTLEGLAPDQYDQLGKALVARVEAEAQTPTPRREP